MGWFSSRVVYADSILAEGLWFSQINHDIKTASTRSGHTDESSGQATQDIFSTTERVGL